MREILRTNDPVLLSFVESLFREAEITFYVADANISVLEGSIGAFPRRILASDDDATEALELLAAAGINDGVARPTDAAPASGTNEITPDFDESGSSSGLPLPKRT